MNFLHTRYRLVLLFTLLCVQQAWAQDGWDWKDPVDVGFIDLADNKLLPYNLLGFGLSELFDSSPKFDSTRLFQFALEHYQEYDRDPLSDVYNASFGIGKHLRKYLSVGVSSHLYAVNTEGDFVTGLGGRVWFAWHIVNKPSFQLTFDNGVGPNYFTSPYPVGGTRFNFTSYYGVKFSARINDRWWSLRLTNIHISNADIRGRERNPAMDAIGISLGVEW